MLGIEANQKIRQGLADEAFPDRQMNASGTQSFDVGQLGVKGFIEPQLLRVMLDQQHPGVRQLDIAPPVLDQADAHIGFQLGDLPAHRGYRDAKTVRGRTHRAQFGGLIEIAEIQVLHEARSSKTAGQSRSMAYLASVAEIQRSTPCSRMVRGMLPPSKIWSWKARKSNRVPNSSSARRRSSRILSSPSLYESAWPGYAT